MSVDLAAKVVFFFDMRNIDDAILLFWHRFCIWKYKEHMFRNFQAKTNYDN